jgi:hypothetical protein
MVTLLFISPNNENDYFLVGNQQGGSIGTKYLRQLDVYNTMYFYDSICFAENSL